MTGNGAGDLRVNWIARLWFDELTTSKLYGLTPEEIKTVENQTQTDNNYSEEIEDEIL